MGMVLTLVAAREDQINAMIADPARVGSFLDDQATAEAASDGPEGAHGARRDHPPTAAGEATPREIDLDKSWHAIHWLLTGTADEASMPAGALLGGREVGEDQGYGPARIVSAAETAAYAKQLAVADRATLEARWDFEGLRRAEIYPEMWARRDPEHIAYVLDYADDLRGFVAARAAAGEGMVLLLT
ncbi:MAG: YfbM family protein [Paracoccaceae bacterium]